MNASLQHFLWNVAGAERSILEKCPTDHKKFAAIGATILMTAIIAFFAGTSAAWYFTQSGTETSGNFLGSCAFGLLWATLIFTIDRSLVITLKKNPELTKQKWAVPFFSRAALAVLIAFMVSIPLELLVFESFINEKREDYNLAEVGNYTSKSKEMSGEDKLDIEVDRASKDIDRLGGDETKAKGKVDSLESQIQQWNKKKDDPSNSSAYVSAKREYNNKKTEYDEALKAYNENQRQSKPSYEGVSNALNKMTKAKKAWERSCQEKITPLEKQLTAAREELLGVQSQLQQSRNNLNNASARRDTLANKRYERQNEKEIQMVNGNHFIRNFEILDWAVLPSNNDGKWMDFIFLWMIRLLFFIVEILPTVVKIVTPVGSYDWMVHREEEDMKEYLKSSEYGDSIKRMHEIELQAREDLLQQQHAAEQELKKQILERMRDAQMKVADAAIAKWESDQLAKLSAAAISSDSSLSDTPYSGDDEDDFVPTATI